MADNEAHAGGDSAFELAVAQFLALARAANVSFDLVDGRVVMRAVNLRQREWQPIRALLDEIGIGRIEAFLRETTPAERHALAAIAPAEPAAAARP